MYQDGFVFHATPETCAPKADAAIGPCVAAATSASRSGRSEPNFLKASADFLVETFRGNSSRQYPSTSIIASANAPGASWGRLCPTPPETSRCRYFPENRLA